MSLLFAYGSNVAASEMEAWFPEARLAGLARLPDHRLALNRRSIRWGGGAVDLVPAPGEEVWGVLYEIPEGELDRLDAKEGEGWAYRRVGVEVEFNGRGVTADAYEVIEKEPEEVRPTPEYAALLERAARERGLPDHWVARLATLGSASKPPPTRGRPPARRGAPRARRAASAAAPPTIPRRRH